MLEASGAARSLSRALAGRHYGRLNLSASRKELTYREQQPEQRQHDEHDLMDVILARWQVAQEVRRPEDRVVAERVKGPRSRRLNAVTVIMTPKRPMPMDDAPMALRYAAPELGRRTTTRPYPSVATPTTSSAIQLARNRSSSDRISTTALNRFRSRRAGPRQRSSRPPYSGAIRISRGPVDDMQG